MNDLSITQVYEQLRAAYGPQSWWPADSPFEVMVGAILTQNTAWTNVEKAFASLRQVVPIAPEPLAALAVERLAAAIKPAGYFNVKARRLQAFCRWFVDAGGFERLTHEPTADLRTALLSVHGVGPETADDILLYAFGRPVFVVDAYTRRLFGRLQKLAGDGHYEHLRHGFEAALPSEVELFKEYHALIVAHGKQVCRPQPRCAGCVLHRSCPTARFSLAVRTGLKER
ncbi:MAG: endonuclease [Acidiferrobacter sp.]